MQVIHCDSRSEFFSENVFESLLEIVDLRFGGDASEDEPNIGLQSLEVFLVERGLPITRGERHQARVVRSARNFAACEDRT